MTIRLLVIFLLSSFFCTSPCSALGSTSTLAISPSTKTICAVLASNRTVKCARGSESFTLEPNASGFTSVSGARNFLCGLLSRPATTPLLCWGTSLASTVNQTKRIYRGQPPLEDLTVGAYHVAAAVPGGGVRWWRDGGRFPPLPAGKYRSLTSGNEFTCGINGSNLVQCWGSTGKDQEIEQAFMNVPMNTIEAGDSHACGITGAGEVLCGGKNDSGQLVAPANSAPFEFSALALGDTHTCALRKADGTVVCWGGGAGGAYNLTDNLSFKLITAGGDLTCGVSRANFSVMCWRLPVPSNSADVETLGSLGTVLPGICKRRTECRCGLVSGSQTLCGRSGDEVICSPCRLGSLPPTHSPPPAPSPEPPTASPRPGRSKRFWAAVIVGSVGSFAGLLSVIYCLWLGVCRRKKKVHNSVQPAILPLSNGAPSLHRNATGNRFSRTKSTSSTLSASSAKSYKSRLRRQGSRVMRRQRSGPSTVTNEYSEGNVKVFTFEELSTATKCFALDTKIGSGSFGTVYRGRLPDGREVAIKRREQPVVLVKEKETVQQDKEGEFQSEVSSLSRLHHKHLVGLVGFCEEGDERLLVYEYMKNGSLHDHIHPKTNGRGGKEHHAGDPLSFWKMRIKVLLDASKGIDYLHNYAVPPIIHRDIKSSNILLDVTWTAKVSDFGLSLSEPELGVVAAPVKKAGTVGYIDPEYYALHYLTVKSDVYGFGVVMLEVLTGKRAIFKNLEDGNLTNVVDYASDWISLGKISQVLDPRMPAPGPREVDAVERVANTALLCVNLESQHRPTMTDVVANLEIALSLCEESQDNLSSASISFTSLD